MAFYLCMFEWKASRDKSICLVYILPRGAQKNLATGCSRLSLCRFPIIKVRKTTHLHSYIQTHTMACRSQWRWQNSECHGKHITHHIDLSTLHPVDPSREPQVSIIWQLPVSSYWQFSLTLWVKGAWTSQLYVMKKQVEDSSVLSSACTKTCTVPSPPLFVYALKLLAFCSLQKEQKRTEPGGSQINRSLKCFPILFARASNCFFFSPSV